MSKKGRENKIEGNYVSNLKSLALGRHQASRVWPDRTSINHKVLNICSQLFICFRNIRLKITFGFYKYKAI